MVRFVNFLAALLFSLAWTAPAIGQTPIERSFPETGFHFPNRSKPAEQQAAEQAAADAHEAACDVGDFSACRDLGRAFQKGEGRLDNRPIAELLYRQACDGADAMGCLWLGQLLAISTDLTDREMGAVFVRRACRLGLLEACDAYADELAAGVLAAPDPQGAEVQRRAACVQGSPISCLELARSLTAQDKSGAEQDEGRALLDRLCRGGNHQACRDAAAHWDQLAMPDAAMQAAQYLALGCDAGDMWLCYDRGLLDLGDGTNPAGRTAALPFLTRACDEAGIHCALAEHIREEPRLASGCDSGDVAACVALGKLLVNGSVPFEFAHLKDERRALALLGPACRAGTPEVCLLAGNLALAKGRIGAAAQPDEGEAYLSLGCLGGAGEACEALADELASGAVLAQDLERAALLYEPQCKGGRSSACEFLEYLAINDPDKPLALANADFTRDPMFDEAGEDEADPMKQGQTDPTEPPGQHCEITTVEFRGQVYRDRFCVNLLMIIRGFEVDPGARPWQALLWRPQVLNGTPLDDTQRVLCGGAVVQKGWILTAAHCLTDERGVSIITAGHRIRLGLSNPLNREGFTYPILRAFAHPNYDRRTHAFDVALVQYDPRGAERGNRVLPIAGIRIDPQPLAHRPVRVGTPLYTYGWGRTALRGSEKPNVLRGARLELRDAASCTNTPRWRNHARDNRANSVLCAAGSQGQQACFGDSGGPLISYGDADRVPTLVGVVSAGTECGTTHVPSRYIRIAHPLVIGWINRVLGSQMVR
ncbi:MAG: trypsin-like serine protease [Erythrobacter sp.]